LIRSSLANIYSLSSCSTWKGCPRFITCRFLELFQLYLLSDSYFRHTIKVHLFLDFRIQFHCPQDHVMAGWRLETRLDSTKLSFITTLH
jgi:hypothetical protein